MSRITLNENNIRNILRESLKAILKEYMEEDRDRILNSKKFQDFLIGNGGVDMYGGRDEYLSESTDDYYDGNGNMMLPGDLQADICSDNDGYGVEDNSENTESPGKNWFNWADAEYNEGLVNDAIGDESFEDFLRSCKRDPVEDRWFRDAEAEFNEGKRNGTISPNVDFEDFLREHD